MQVAQTDTLLGERPVERNQQRLVVGPDRSDREPRAVAGGLVPDVFGRVRANGGPGQLRDRERGIVQDDARIQRDDARRRRQQRVDVDLVDPALVGDEIAEAHEQRREAVEIDGGPAANTAQRPRDPRLARPAGARASSSAAAAPARGRATPRPARRPRRTSAPVRAADRRCSPGSARGPRCDRPSAARSRRGNSPPRPSRRPKPGCHRRRARTAASSASPSLTPPTSVLCVMTCDQSFTATGKPDLARRRDRRVLVSAPRASARPGCRSWRARPWLPPRRAASCPRRSAPSMIASTSAGWPSAPVLRQRRRLVERAQVVGVPSTCRRTRARRRRETRRSGCRRDSGCLDAVGDALAAHPAREHRLALDRARSGSAPRRSASDRSCPAASGSPAGRRSSGSAAAISSACA